MPAEARDLTEADGGDDGPMSKVLASLDVGEMDFDRRHTNGHDSVADSMAVMGISSRVDDQTIGPASRLVNRVNDGPFVVRLEGAYFDTPVTRRPALPVEPRKD